MGRAGHAGRPRVRWQGGRRDVAAAATTWASAAVADGAQACPEEVGDGRCAGDAARVSVDGKVEGRELLRGRQGAGIDVLHVEEVFHARETPVAGGLKQPVLPVVTPRLGRSVGSAGSAHCDERQVGARPELGAGGGFPNRTGVTKDLRIALHRRCIGEVGMEGTRPRIPPHH
eukprot:9503951-Pyramimonas_sp.AAC.2